MQTYVRFPLSGGVRITSSKHHGVRVLRVDVITTNRLSTFVNSTMKAQRSYWFTNTLFV